MTQMLLEPSDRIDDLFPMHIMRCTMHKRNHIFLYSLSCVVTHRIKHETFTFVRKPFDNNKVCRR